MKIKISFFFSKVLPVLIWMAVIYVFSSFSGSNYPKEPEIFSWTAHFSMYFILGYFVARMFDKKGISAFLMALVICLVYAISDEWHQSFVPGREASLVDFGVDGVGGLIGILGHYFKE